MENTNIQNNINETLLNARGNIIDVYYTLYADYIDGQQEPSKALEIILQSIVDVSAKFDDSPTKVAIETVGIVQRRFRVLLNETARAIMRLDLPVSEFYEKLYNSVFNSDIFGQNLEERAILLYMLRENNPLFPYFPSKDPYKMNNERFKDVQSKIYPYIVKALHILKRGYETKTEETSQLMVIADEINEYEEKVVFWSVVIELIKKNSNKEK